MSQKHAATARSRGADSGEKFFTIASANRALVLVRRVTQDIVDRYAELMALRSEREELAQTAGHADRLELLQREITARIDRLNRLQDELSDIGCELKDYKLGLVDFPAQRAGRKVWLCWRLGEAELTHWHELETGFAGRMPIDAEFTA
jgi:hypothetical protein